MKWIGLLLVGTIIIMLISLTCNMCKDTSRTIQKEYAPSALLKKYEYFKDLSAAIDEKDANIQIYRSELTSYKVVDKDDKFYYEQRKSELFGIISIRNSLAATYNSQMSKFNWRFTNKGDLPASNLEPLPREYKPYILSLN